MDLNAIKQKLNHFNQPKTPREKIDYTKVYFKPKPGKYQIRVVPSKFDKSNPFREVYFHYGISKFPLLALTNWGEKDPIVELVEELRKTKDPENWKLAKKLTPKTRTFLPVVVRGAEEEGVRLWEFGKEVYMQLLALAADDDYGDFTDIAEGRDFTIEVIQATAFDKVVNKISSIRIKPNKSVLSDNAQLVEKLLNEQPDVLTLNKKNTYDEVKAVLQKFIENSEPTKDTDDEVVTEDDTEEVKTTNADKFEKLFKQQQ